MRVRLNSPCTCPITTPKYVEMNPKSGKLSSGSGGSKGSNRRLLRNRNKKGPLDMFFTTNPVDVAKARKDQGRQKTIGELSRKELREKA